MSGYIYLVHADGTDRYKIGFTTLEPSSRISRLQTGSPFRLKLISCFKGSMDDETALHQRFDLYSCGGEWFEFTSLVPVLKHFNVDPPEDWEPIKRGTWNRDAVAIEIGCQVMAWGRQVSRTQARQFVVRKRKPKEFWYSVVDKLGLPNAKPDELPIPQMEQILEWYFNR